MLTRTVAGASSTRAYRNQIREDGDVVLNAHIPRREAFAQAYGDPILRAATSAYGDAVMDLLDLEESL